MHTAVAGAHGVGRCKWRNPEAGDTAQAEADAGGRWRRRTRAQTLEAGAHFGGWERGPIRRAQG
jgi:hypothetical protein